MNLEEPGGSLGVSGGLWGSPVGLLWVSWGSPGGLLGLLGVSGGYPCLEHEIHAKVLILHLFYKQTVIWAKTNVARTLVLETSAKMMLLWHDNGDASELRFRATAT